MKKNGFTLIELLVTIALIAIITTIVVVNMTGLQQNENEELYTAYKSRITTAACNYIDNMENENLRNWCKATSTGCKIYISTLVNEGLVDGEEVDPKTNIKLKDETTSAYIIVDWTEDNGYKVKKCAFYDDENNKSVDELDLSSACKYSQTFVGTTLNVTYGCDEDKAVYGCKTADKTISYSDNASDLKWTIEDNYNHKATCSHAIVLTKKYTVKHYQMNIDGTYPDEPTEVDEGIAYIGKKISPNVKTYEGFTSPDMQSITIADNSDNVIEYKYVRNTYHVTIDKKDYAGTINGEGQYLYGQDVKINIDSILPGYINNGLSTSDTLISLNTEDNINYSFTMPSRDINLIYNYSLINYNITYDLNGGVDNGNPSTYTVLDEISLKVPSNHIALLGGSYFNKKFTGWTENDEDTPEINVTIAKGTTGDKQFKANWENGNWIALKTSDLVSIQSKYANNYIIGFLSSNSCFSSAQDALDHAEKSGTSYMYYTSIWISTASWGSTYFWMQNHQSKGWWIDNWGLNNPYGYILVYTIPNN